MILPPDGAPVPSFFFSPTTPREDDDVYFDGSASTDGDGRIVAYSWAFGDGKTETSSSSSIRHHYDLAGTYNVVLTVTDDRGLSVSTKPQQVQVAAITDPIASFTVSPTAPTPHTLVTFDASGSKASTGRSIVEYQYNFGDGSPISKSSHAIANHVFTADGEYVVTLKVTDSSGRVGAASNTVSVATPTP